MLCPRCHAQATEIRAFLLLHDDLAYCQNCGWNVGRATTKLRLSVRVMWMIAGIGVLLAISALTRGPGGISGALLVAVPFIGLPVGSGLVARYRLSRISAAPAADRAQVARPKTPVPVIQTTEYENNDASLALPPRAVHLTIRGYLHIAAVVLATAVLLWWLSVVLQGIGDSHASLAKYVMAFFGWSWGLWSCVSFFRNRIRERRLFVNGEVSQGLVLAHSKTNYANRIVYGYRDARGNSFQSRATDFSNKLYEEMPINVFYDPLNSRQSAPLQGSFYRFG